MQQDDGQLWWGGGEEGRQIDRPGVQVFCRTLCSQWASAVVVCLAVNCSDGRCALSVDDRRTNCHQAMPAGAQPEEQRSLVLRDPDHAKVRAWAHMGEAISSAPRAWDENHSASYLLHLEKNP